MVKAIAHDFIKLLHDYRRISSVTKLSYFKNITVINVQQNPVSLYSVDIREY